MPRPVRGWLWQLAALRRDFLGFLSDQARIHGDVVALTPVPTTRFVLVSDPALISEILTTRASEFTKSKQTRTMVGKFLGDGLVLSEGETHRCQRRRLAPAFNGGAVAALGPAIAAEATKWCDEALAKDGPFDFGSAMSDLTLSMIAMALFGGAAEGLGELGAATRTFADAMAQRFNSMPWPGWLPTARNRRETHAIASLDASLAKFRTEDAPVEGARPPLASWLSEAVTRGDITPTEWRDQIATLLFAGHETTAKVLAWLFHLLAWRPELQADLVDELRGVTSPGETLTPAAIQGLPFLDAVLSECLRLYPPVWLFDRSPMAETELGGHKLTSRDAIYLSPYVTQRDPRWFADPLQFAPRRFLDGNVKNAPPFAYLPFGGGPRVCVGRALATVEVKLIAATILARFRVEAVGGERTISPAPGATLGMARPLIVRLRRREI